MVKKSLAAIKNMLPAIIFVVACVLGPLQSGYCADGVNAADANEAKKRFNNEAVMALSQRNYPTAIKCLEAAIHLDPDYSVARHNLAVSCNNYALSLPPDPAKTVFYFRKALYAEENNPVSKAHYNECLTKMGLDVNDVAVHQKLAEDCVAANDLSGGIVEYRQALSLKADPKLAEKLARLQEMEKKAP